MADHCTVPFYQLMEKKNLKVTTWKLRNKVTILIMTIFELGEHSKLHIYMKVIGDRTITVNSTMIIVIARENIKLSLFLKK